MGQEARDLSSYLASRTLAYLRKKTVTRTADSAFYRDGSENRVGVFGGRYRLIFIDDGNVINVQFDRHVGVIPEEVFSVELKVPAKYQGVVDDVQLTKSEGGLLAKVHMTPKNNTQNRTNNRERILYALLNSTVKPVLARLLECDSPPRSV